MSEQRGPCCICGKVGYPLSCGGPTICPSCDCGNFGPEVVQWQAREIERLRADLDEALDIIDALLVLEPGSADRGTKFLAKHDSAVNQDDGGEK